MTDTAKHVGTVLTAKGIAILLVVAGHYTTAGEPAWWSEARDIIYRFHMPLFFMLSGYLYGFHGEGKGPFLKTVGKKARRLLYPFASITIIVFLIKYAAGSFLDLRNPVTPGNLLDVLVDPVKSFNPLLWFIYTLFLIFAIFPALLRLIKNPYLVLAATLGLALFNWPDIVTLPMLFDNLPVFAIGYIIGGKYDLDRTAARTAIWAGAASLAVFSSAYYRLDALAAIQVSGQPAGLIFAVSGSVFCIAVSSLIRKLEGWPNRILTAAGLYSMSIYLLHTMFEGGVRVLFTRVFDLGHLQFTVSALVAIILGTVVPLCIERYGLRRKRITRKLILGMK